MLLLKRISSFFFFNDTATTEIYTLSLHDALPISGCNAGRVMSERNSAWMRLAKRYWVWRLYHFIDRKSTRLNSSHGYISYAVFCLKKKKKKTSMNLLYILLIAVDRLTDTANYFTH